MNTEIIKFLKSIGGKILLFSLLVFLSAILNLASSPNPTTIITLAFSIILIFVSIFSYKNNSKSGAADKTRNAELEAVIQNVKDGVIIYDTNFRILDLNAAAEEIFKISKEEVLGVQIQPEKAQNQHFRIFVETIFPSLASSINTISDSGWPKVVDITFEDPHLELRTYLNQVTDDVQNVIGFIKTVSNDTRENTILKSKGEFLTVAAHQLRTPLTAISWTFESIKNFLSDDNTTKNKEDLKKLTDEG
ncbi:PAS domain-containing protein, partial [Patescibacteria group bacterium]|nr:PAS domain-containing protein [Patescibacteria group bacterium]